MRHFLILLALSPVLSVTGCSQDAAPGPVPAQSSAFVGAGLVSFGPQDVTVPRSREDMLAGIERTQRAQEALSAALADADPSDIPDVHRRLQEALAALDGEVLSRAQQLASAAMIRVALVPAPETEETRQIASVYSQYLVDNESPQADLVLSGLDETGDAWTPEQHRHAAAVGVEAAERSRQSTTPAREASRERMGARPAHATDAAVAQLSDIAQAAE